MVHESIEKRNSQRTFLGTRIFIGLCSIVHHIPTVREGLDHLQRSLSALITTKASRKERCLELRDCHLVDGWIQSSFALTSILGSFASFALCSPPCHRGHALILTMGQLPQKTSMLIRILNLRIIQCKALSVNTQERHTISACSSAITSLSKASSTRFLTASCASRAEVTRTTGTCFEGQRVLSFCVNGMDNRRS